MEQSKRRMAISLPELSMIVGARAMVSAGVALLISERMTSEQRTAVGRTLFTVGAVISIPMVLELMAGMRQVSGEQPAEVTTRRAA